ncbi:MAG: hypothetical protein Q4D16_11830 [Eubacteriales bacterium]|nr:hypothetical protein [Eubacteriales bacterium]
MKKKSITGLLAFAVTVVIGGGLLLPVLAEASLEKESGKVHQIENEKEEPSDLEQEDPAKEISLSEEQAEPFIRMGKEAVQEKLNVPFLESVKPVYQQADSTGQVFVTWSGPESDAVSAEENSYYTVEFKDADIEKGTGTVHSVSVSGSVLQDLVKELQEDAEDNLLKEFSDRPSGDETVYPGLSWEDGSCRVRFLWSGDRSGDYIFHEAVYEDVDQNHTSGELVYLHSLKSEMANAAVMENLSQEKTEELQACAEEYGTGLGYDITGYVDHYKFSDTVYFVFDVNDSRFSQISLALNSSGELCGRAVGENIMEQAMGIVTGKK